MLDKKEVVQKSFRITKQNEIWLSLLAIKLGRTQNELVNFAIKMLLDDNKKWFFEEFIRSTFNIDSLEVRHNDIHEKKRLGDTEVEVVTYNEHAKGNGICLNITYYEDDLSNSVKNTDQVRIDFGPGYENRILSCLTNIFEETLNRYPKIMKNFNPGLIIEDY